MRMLAIETSGTSGSVATLEAGEVPRGLPLDSSQRSARTLAPTIRDVVKQAGWQPRQVDVVAVVAGPGSFTGLRIGVTTAKTLAYALEADLVAVDTLDVLARQAPMSAGTLHAVIDAFRGELFTARFKVVDGHWTRSDETHLVGVEPWLAALSAGDVVTGPVLEKLGTRLPSTALVANATAWQPRAETVAELAAELYLAGRRDDPWKLVPWYGRLAAAEEKRRGGSMG